MGRVNSGASRGGRWPVSKDGYLVTNGRVVFSVNLQKLLLDRVRGLGGEWVRQVVEMEKRTAIIASERGLNYLQTKLTPLIEGPDGMAADFSRVIDEYVDRNPKILDRELAIILIYYGKLRY
jgi:hypothetical protein